MPAVVKLNRINISRAAKDGGAGPTRYTGEVELVVESYHPGTVAEKIQFTFEYKFNEFDNIELSVENALVMLKHHLNWIKDACEPGKFVR